MCTTVVEVKKHIQDSDEGYLIKLVTGCVVLVMSSCHNKDISLCHICIKKYHNWANDT